MFIETTLLASLLDIFHDPTAIAMISLIIAIAAIIIGLAGNIFSGVFPVWKQHTIKKLEYQIILNTPIVNITKAVKSRVEVLLDGKSANNVRLIVINIRNSGNTSITRGDYFDPIMFEFDEEVIDRDILETEPIDLLQSVDKETFLKVQPKSVQIPPFSLNPQDSIEFSCDLTIFLSWLLTHIMSNGWLLKPVEKSA